MTIISNLDENKTLNNENIEKKIEKIVEDGFVTFKEKTNGEIKAIYHHVEHATSLIKEFLLFRNDSGFYYYERSTGLWKDDAVAFIKNVITNRLDGFSKDNWVKECYNNIFHRVYDNKKIIEFEPNPYLVNVENGVVDLKTGHLLEFNPYFYQRIKIPHEYVKNSDCPKIKDFITDVVEPEQVRFIFEWVGYTLLKNYPMRKILIMLGNGKNGKSVLIQLMTELVGKPNTSTISLYDLQAHKFALAELNGKSLNAGADIDSTFFSSLDKIKGLTGGDGMMAERKNGHPFSFINHAKLTYSCNELPTFKERTFAVKDRLIVLPFEKQFTEETKNDNILSELTTEREMQGLLFHAIEAIRHVLAEGKFSISTKMERVTQAWFEEMDNIKAFVDDCCFVEEGAFVRRNDLYDEYKVFCESNGYKPEKSTNFLKHLKQSIPGVYDHRKKDSARKNVTYIHNIGLLKN